MIDRLFLNSIKIILIFSYFYIFIKKRFINLFRSFMTNLKNVKSENEKKRFVHFDLLDFSFWRPLKIPNYSFPIEKIINRGFKWEASDSQIYGFFWKFNRFAKNVQWAAFEWIRSDHHHHHYSVLASGILLKISNEDPFDCPIVPLFWNSRILQPTYANLIKMKCKFFTFCICWKYMIK